MSVALLCDVSSEVSVVHTQGLLRRPHVLDVTIKSSCYRKLNTKVKAFAAVFAIRLCSLRLSSNFVLHQLPLKTFLEEGGKIELFKRLN